MGEGYNAIPTMLCNLKRTDKCSHARWGLDRHGIDAKGSCPCFQNSGQCSRCSTADHNVRSTSPRCREHNSAHPPTESAPQSLCHASPWRFGCLCDERRAACRCWMQTARHRWERLPKQPIRHRSRSGEERLPGNREHKRRGIVERSS